MKNHRKAHYFWQLLVHIQRVQARRHQSGYAMLVTSILAILVFSMLSVYLFSTNLYKSVATSMVDSNTTFYAAEYALNKRAHKVRLRFDDYSSPSGTSPGTATSTPAQQMKVCMDANLSPNVETTNDFECRMMQSDFKETIVKNGGKANSLMETVVNQDNIKYRTYTFVRDLTTYASGNQVLTTRIPVGDEYAGLFSLEYRYRVYASAAKEMNLGASDPSVISSQSMLQMDFNNRLIPLFQFAVFYENDLEIANGPNLTMTGPVHTNGRLFLSPDGSTLTFNGNVTSVGKIYKNLEFVSRSKGNIAFDAGTGFQGTGETGVLAANEVSESEITASKRLKHNQKYLTLPPINFLTRAGEYYEDADMRVDFDPATTTNEPIKIRAFGTDLSAEATRSLRQPVLVRPVARGTEAASAPLSEITRLCPRLTLTDKSEPTTVAEAIPTITNATLQGIRNTASGNTAVLALQTAIAKLPNGTAADIAFSDTTKRAADISATLLANLTTELGSHPQAALILAAPLNQIAALNNSCFAPPPMQISLKRNRREKRNINILQSNIKSLAIWNRDGRYWMGGALTSAQNHLFPTKAASSTIPTATSPAKATSACDFDCMGMGSGDTTHNGLVWHFSVDRTKPAYSYTSGNGKDRGGESPYGFAFIEGRRLPGAMTLVTDQAAYLQGDFNNPSRILGDTDTSLDNSFLPSTSTSPSREKRPAAILSDTIVTLSNGCLDNNYRLSCMRDSTATDAATAMDAATNTVMRAGFLAKTDKTIKKTEPSGQLENYMTFLENWGSRTFKYRGSMLSLGIPTESNGIWNNNNYYGAPTRNWGFDQDFTAAIGLPPMTPRATYLKQKVFRRDYNLQGTN